MVVLIISVLFYIIRDLLLRTITELFIPFIVSILELVRFFFIRFVWCYFLIFIKNVKLLYNYITVWRVLPENNSFLVWQNTVIYFWTMFNTFTKKYNFRTFSGWVMFIDNCFIFLLSHITTILPVSFFIYDYIWPMMKFLYYVYLSIYDVMPVMCLYMGYYAVDYDSLHIYQLLINCCPDCCVAKHWFEWWYTAWTGTFLIPIYKANVQIYYPWFLFFIFLFIYFLKVAELMFFFEYINMKYWYKKVNTSWTLYLHRKTLKRDFKNKAKITLFFQTKITHQIYLYINYVTCLMRSGVIFFDYLLIFIKKIYAFIVYFTLHEKIKLFKISCNYWFRTFFVFWRPLFKRLSYFGYYRTNQSKWFWYK